MRKLNSWVGMRSYSTACTQLLAIATLTLLLLPSPWIISPAPSAPDNLKVFGDWLGAEHGRKQRASSPCLCCPGSRQPQAGEIQTRTPRRVMRQLSSFPSPVQLLLALWDDSKCRHHHKGTFHIPDHQHPKDLNCFAPCTGSCRGGPQRMPCITQELL